MKQPQTVADFRNLANRFGFCIPSSAKFYRVRATQREGQIGMKVGEYQHSCHIDTIDIFVLLFIDEKGHDSVESVFDLWLTPL